MKLIKSYFLTKNNMFKKYNVGWNKSWNLFILKISSYEFTGSLDVLGLRRLH